MNPWYAVHVIDGCEVITGQLIKTNTSFETMIPRRVLRERKEGEWKGKARSLFPGYVFVSGEMTLQNYYKMKNIFYVIDILKGASSMPVPIRDDEVEMLMKLGGQVLLLESQMLSEKEM